MVSPQITQNSPQPLPKRIPPAIRRQVLREFLSDALITQRAVTEGERIDREATAKAAPTGFFSIADLRVSNAAAVQQWISSNLAAYTDNRDFPGVTQ